MKLKKSILTLSTLLLLSACGSTGNDKEIVAVENDPRIGNEVKSACSISSIRGWQQVDNDRNALIVNMPRDKSYKLSVAGFCDVEWAMVKIAVISKTGSHCIYRGDKVATDADVARTGSCTIQKIEEWHPEKLKKDSEDKPEDKSSQN